jgi:hypothetical protein
MKIKIRYTPTEITMVDTIIYNDSRLILLSDNSRHARPYPGEGGA